MDEFSVAVVGIQYPNADKSDRRFEALLCVPGEEMHLVREPKNKFDEQAIGVWSARGVQIGYITADRCAFLSTKMAIDPHAAIFQHLQGNAAYLRIRFGGERPTLPARQPQPAAVGEWDEYFDDCVPSEWGA